MVKPKRRITPTLTDRMSECRCIIRVNKALQLIEIKKWKWMKKPIKIKLLSAVALFTKSHHRGSITYLNWIKQSTHPWNQLKLKCIEN